MFLPTQRRVELLTFRINCKLHLKSSEHKSADFILILLFAVMFLQLLFELVPKEIEQIDISP